jgi:FKBP-type peptidyl-prolyl cis-trans isomerase
MKLLLCIPLIVIATQSLNARENPFEPTKSYQDEVARMMEIEEDYPVEFQKKSANEYEQFHENELTIQEEAPKKEEAKEETAKKEEKKEEKSAKKEKAAPKVVVPNENLVYVPLREQTYTKKAVIALIPGVEVEFEGRTLHIKSKYEVFQKFDLNDENKIILDFRAQTSFYTIRKELNSQYFNKLVVGNHKEDKFFRIVLELPASPKDYKVTYNDNLVTVAFEESGLK